MGYYLPPHDLYEVVLLLKATIFEVKLPSI